MCMLQGPLPHGYDLILCRDTLQHLPLMAAVAALENFARSGARFLLVRHMSALGSAGAAMLSRTS